jgi:hypothetical protein
MPRKQDSVEKNYVGNAATSVHSDSFCSVIALLRHNEDSVKEGKAGWWAGAGQIDCLRRYLHERQIMSGMIRVND